eukprot:scaffold127991_cov33-Phaeocystis_antarctica.AAC.2
MTDLAARRYAGRRRHAVLGLQRLPHARPERAGLEPGQQLRHAARPLRQPAALALRHAALGGVR